MAQLQFGVTIPYGSARQSAEMARIAEDVGWDGIFVGDAIWCQDPFIQLTAAAMVTQRVRLATMVLAAPLRVPWQTAGQSVALDLLSGGRLSLGLGMGATWMGWHAFPDVPVDTHVRAEMLDETIDILTLLYQRKQFDYDGRHYHLKLTTMDVMHYPPKPVQQPRIPLWAPCVWPRKKSMQRILKCDGLFPQKMNPAGQFVEVTPDDVRAMRDYVAANRTLETPFEIIAEGRTGGLPAQEAREKSLAWAEAGATWFVESLWGLSEDEVNARIRQGPPK